MGIVYNVTDGYYYHPSGSYSFFTGRDGTRAFLTGEFDNEQELRDDLNGLDESYFNGLDTWIKLYNDKYKRVGRVIGFYYDQNGCITKEYKRLLKKFKKIDAEKQKENDELKRYPPCNSQWNQQTNNGRVWCTQLSGGINRSWIGKPKLLYDLYQKKWRCACINEQDLINNSDYCDNNDDSEKMIGMQYQNNNKNNDDDNDRAQATPSCRIKNYRNCDLNSNECSI